jgi:hypothetical protein
VVASSHGSERGHLAWRLAKLLFYQSAGAHREDFVVSRKSQAEGPAEGLRHQQDRRFLESADAI